MELTGASGLERPGAHGTRELLELGPRPDKARPSRCLTSAELFCLRDFAQRRHPPGRPGHRDTGQEEPPDQATSRVPTHTPFPPGGSGSSLPLPTPTPAQAAYSEGSLVP